LKKETTFIIAAALAGVCAIGLFVRLTIQRTSFDKVVKEALKTSEGYDQKLINTVKRLEEELATRASFGYQGGKDPMTGKTRMVVLQQKAPEVKKGAVKGPAVTEAPVVVDPIKLTAIIYDDEQRKYTAVVMDGERSFSVEMGDKVRDRKITQITDQMIFMEDDAMLYVYDIHGKSRTKNK